MIQEDDRKGARLACLIPIENVKKSSGFSPSFTAIIFFIFNYKQQYLLEIQLDKPDLWNQPENFLISVVLIELPSILHS